MNKKPNFDSRQMLEPLPEYARLGLTHNPFLGSGLAPDIPPIAPFPEVRDKLQHFIDSFIRSRQSKGMIILGDYGTGKTYHLRYIESQFKEYGPRLKTVFVATPGLEPYDVIRAILAQIGDEQVAKAVWTLIAPALRNKIASEGQAYFRDLLRDFPPSRRKDVRSIYQTSFEVPFVHLQEDTLTDHRRFLDAFDRLRILSREKLRDDLVPILYRQDGDRVPITTNPAVARELASICLYDGAPGLDSWERLTTAGPGKKALPPRQEAEFLQAILRLLLATKVEYFVLLLDEFEKVPLMQLMTERQAKQYLDTVRMLIDRGWQQLPFAYVLASHDEAWDLVKADLDRALTDRFPTELPLPRLGEVSRARQLLSDLLNLAREGPSTQVNIAPFPPSFFQIVPPEYRNTPRDLITLCYDLVEQAADRQLSTVPEQLIKDYLETYIITEESEAGDAT